MAISRDERRRERRAAFEAAFGVDVDVALDLLEIVELAWHDCYGEITPSPRVLDDMLVLSQGRVDRLVSVARLALADRRDLHRSAAAADVRRSR